MKENLREVRETNIEKAENERVRIIRKHSRLFCLMYDVYDKQEEQLLGTCEVWCKEEADKRIPILKVFESKVPEFPEIVEFANRTITCDE